MKREITIFITNIIIVLALTGTAINFSPYFKDAVTSHAESVSKLANPYSEIKEASSIISQIIYDDSGNNSNTSQGEAVTEGVMHRVEEEDGSDNTDLTATPTDIRKLMDEAERTIESEEVKGKTSEESYMGGGAIASFGNVEVQNKIPSSFYNLDIENLLEKRADLEIKDISKPTVLIYHSHTTESYNLLDVGYYTKSSDRALMMLHGIWCGLGTKFVGFSKARASVLFTTRIYMMKIITRLMAFRARLWRITLKNIRQLKLQ